MIILKVTKNRVPTLPFFLGLNIYVNNTGLFFLSGECVDDVANN